MKLLIMVQRHTLSHTDSHTHTQTWPDSLVDSPQQLYAALVTPVVEDPGQDVEVSVGQSVLEEVSWKTHTHTVEATCNTSTDLTEESERCTSNTMMTIRNCSRLIDQPIAN